MLEDSRASVAQTIQDRLDAAKCVLRAGLYTTNCKGHATVTSVVLIRHTWMRATRFNEDVQASLTDMTYHGSGLFDKKTDSVLERIKDSCATARALGLLSLARQFHVHYRKLRGGSRGLVYQQCHPSQSVQQQTQPFWDRGLGGARGLSLQQGQRFSNSSFPVAAVPKPLWFGLSGP